MIILRPKHCHDFDIQCGCLHLMQCGHNYGQCLRAKWKLMDYHDMDPQCGHCLCGYLLPAKVNKF
jgi:hypothetical protein